VWGRGIARKGRARGRWSYVRVFGRVGPWWRLSAGPRSGGTVARRWASICCRVASCKMIDFGSLGVTIVVVVAIAAVQCEKVYLP